MDKEGEKQPRRVFGQVIKIDIGDFSGVKHGQITLRLRDRQIRELTYDRDSRGEIPTLSDYVIAEYMSRQKPRIVEIKLQRRSSRGLFKDPLPTSVPDPKTSNNILILATMLLLIIFGLGTAISTFSSDFLKFGDYSLPFIDGGMIVILSFSVRYKEPEILFDEETGSYRYGFFTILELLFTSGGVGIWYLAVSGGLVLPVNPEVLFLFFSLGLVCLILVSIRVAMIYRHGIEDLDTKLKTNECQD